jgi:hypothetical protein
MQYHIINLETGDFQIVTLEEAAEIAQLDPHDVAWAIEEQGVCETETYQITKLAGLPEEECDGGEDGDADFKEPLPVFVYISQEEFEARLAESPAAVIRLKWDEPIVREAVEADRERVMRKLRGEEGGGDVEPSGVFHLTREEIALVR